MKELPVRKKNYKHHKLFYNKPSTGSKVVTPHQKKNTQKQQQRTTTKQQT
jgi:hypothetical protein